MEYMRQRLHDKVPYYKCRYASNASHSPRGWLVYLYSFICLSAGAVEWESSCFATTLLHHALPKLTSVLVLFVIFGDVF